MLLALDIWLCQFFIGRTVEPSRRRQMKKISTSPRKSRSAYQIFIKRKCEQLRETQKRQKGQSFLNMAIDAWKSLSEEERQVHLPPLFFSFFFFPYYHPLSLVPLLLKRFLLDYLQVNCMFASLGKLGSQAKPVL